jgi:succinate dehydrogenase / fumarate reductase, cytochrome b subunit
MSYPTFDLTRSITKKQIVAASGLLLILFVIAHLLGNLYIYGGPESLNGYAQKLNQLGSIKYAFRWALFFIFLIHITFTILVVTENIKARGMSRYKVDNSRGPRSLSTRLMPYSGAYLIIYLIYHLYDFTLAPHHGPNSMINGMDLGLWGLVVNTFRDPFHSMFYVIAMGFLSLHLSHGVESVLQTFGFNDHRFTPKIKKFSNYFAFIIMAAYSSIPLYVLTCLK